MKKKLMALAVAVFFIGSLVSVVWAAEPTTPAKKTAVSAPKVTATMPAPRVKASGTVAKMSPDSVIVNVKGVPVTLKTGTAKLGSIKEGDEVNLSYSEVNGAKVLKSIAPAVKK